MANIFKSVTVLNSHGNGVYVAGNSDSVFENLHIENTMGGEALTVGNERGLHEQLGIPAEVPLSELQPLLDAIRGASKDKQEEVIKGSDFLKKWGGRIVNTAGFVSSVITIAAAIP